MIKQWSVRNFLLFLIFFIVFYIEVIDVFGIKFALLWKVCFLLFLLFFLISKKTYNKIPKVSLWGLLFSFQSIFNLSLFANPVANITDAIKIAYIPLLFAVYGDRFLNVADGEKILKFLLLISQFIVLSTLPFLVGLIEPLSTGYNLSIFGLDDKGFVGIFQTAHTAAITVASALIVLVYFFSLTHQKSDKLWLFFLISVGFTVLYYTYVRTGYLIFMIGVLVILLAKPSRYRLLAILLFIITLLVVGVFLFAYSDVFRMRILGSNIYMDGGGNSSIGIGSGREIFWASTFVYFFAQNAFAQFVGLGSTVGMDLMHNSVGLRIYAHNGFIDILQFYGFIGLLIYFIFIFYIVRELIRARGTSHFSLMVAIFAAYLAQMGVQGERVFLADFLFSLTLVLGRHFSVSRFKMNISSRNSSLLY